MAFIDSIIAQAFGVEICWSGLLAMTAEEYQPLQRFLNLPAGGELAYALMAGYRKYKPGKIPESKTLKVE